MGSKNKLKETDIKTRYYFDGLTNINDLDLDNILLNENSYENNLIYDVACKISYATKPLLFTFDKMDEYIRKYDRTKYPALFISGKYIFGRIRYLSMSKSNILYVYSRKYLKIKINEKTLDMNNVVILIKNLFNKNHNYYYYQLFFRKMFV